jgi:hypothetical protein
VTRLVKWTAVNQSVINVDDHGEVTVVGNGESALSAWCLQQIAVATVASPFPNQVPAEAFAQAPRRNLDRRTRAGETRSRWRLPPFTALHGRGVHPRACIDTMGMLPTAEETTGSSSRMPRLTSGTG